MPDDLRHENISNDLQTTCRTFEIQLKELRAENDAKENKIAELKTMLLEKTDSPADSARVKELEALLDIAQNQMKEQHIQVRESFSRLINDVHLKDTIDGVPSDRGDSDRIDGRLSKKQVS